jgi:hypothetical protein
MALVKASKDSEAGVMPTQQMWEEMDQFNVDEIVIPTQAMMSARAHRKAHYRLGMRRFASFDAPARILCSAAFQPWTPAIKSSGPR